MKKKILFIALLFTLIAVISVVVFALSPKYNLEKIPEEFQVIEMQGEELKILNLTDIQLTPWEWQAQTKSYEIAQGTIAKLIEQEKPDLITITGDHSYSSIMYYETGYELFVRFMDSFEIPWAPVWGNHDNEGGEEAVKKMEKKLADSSYSLFREGPEDLGSGNYTILISDGKKIVEGLIFMDTHNASYRLNSSGDKVIDSYDSLTPQQMDWYRRQVAVCEDFGCKDTSIFIHIPIYAYRDAYNAADGYEADDHTVPRDESHKDTYWFEGYEDSFGVRRDGFGQPKEDDGVFAVLKEMGSTKHVFCGHDHKNNYSIVYDGIRLTYGTKTGAGGYWQSDLNGGTIITVDKKGINDVRHVYIDDYIGEWVAPY